MNIKGAAVPVDGIASDDNSSASTWPKYLADHEVGFLDVRFQIFRRFKHPLNLHALPNRWSFNQYSNVGIPLIKTEIALYSDSWASVFDEVEINLWPFEFSWLLVENMKRTTSINLQRQALSLSLSYINLNDFLKVHNWGFCYMFVIDWTKSWPVQALYDALFHGDDKSKNLSPSGKRFSLY